MVDSLVLMFDRDQTVDLNFDKHQLFMDGSISADEDPRPFPLKVIKHLAHDEVNDDIDVWAHGNQKLTREAAIPGIADARRLYKRYYTDDFDSDVSESLVSNEDTFERKSLDRMQGINLIKDLYEGCAKAAGVEPPGFIAVDDVDLSGNKGVITGTPYVSSGHLIEHYTAWDLMDALDNEIEDPQAARESLEWTGTSFESEACQRYPEPSLEVLRQLVEDTE